MKLVIMMMIAIVPAIAQERITIELNGLPHSTIPRIEAERMKIEQLYIALDSTLLRLAAIRSDSARAIAMLTAQVKTQREILPHYVAIIEHYSRHERRCRRETKWLKIFIPIAFATGIFVGR
jgi:hypothetical protein